MRTKFKKGDTVKILDAKNVRRFGVVESIGMTFVLGVSGENKDEANQLNIGESVHPWGNRFYCNYEACDLEVVKSASKFKIGDTVKCIKDRSDPKYVAMIGVVVEITKEHFIVDFGPVSRNLEVANVGNSRRMFEEEIVLAPEGECECRCALCRFRSRKAMFHHTRNFHFPHHTSGDEADQVDAYAYMLFSSRLRHLNQSRSIRFGRARRKDDTSIVLRHFLERNQPFRTNYIKVKAGSFSSMRFKIHVSYDTPPSICKVEDCTNRAKSKGSDKGHRSLCGGCINRKRRALKELRKYE